MGKKVSGAIALVLAVAFIDLFVRKCAAIPAGSWSVDNRINPIEVANLVLTIAITIWLGVFVSRRLSAERYEKEFLISDLREIESAIGLIQSHAKHSATVELQLMINLNASLKISVSRFAETAELFGISVNNRYLSNCWASLYRVTTDVDGVELDMSDRKVFEINSCCNEFIIQLRKVIKQINLR